MKNIFTISLAFLVFSLNLKSQPTMESKVIINFNETSSITNWKIVDDVVMGGRSSSNFALNSDGFGLFKGEVSLENNGGFSSLRCDLNRIAVGNYTKIQIRLKGDGKKYQLRIKSDNQEYYSYIMPFSTSGEWQEIDFELKDMYPSFRGRNLDMPNFSNEYFEQLTFLIGNKKNENFELLIDEILLK